MAKLDGSLAGHGALVFVAVAGDGVGDADDAVYAVVAGDAVDAVRAVRDGHDAVAATAAAAHAAAADATRGVDAADANAAAAGRAAARRAAHAAAPAAGAAAESARGRRDRGERPASFGGACDRWGRRGKGGALLYACDCKRTSTAHGHVGLPDSTRTRSRIESAPPIMVVAPWRGLVTPQPHWLSTQFCLIDSISPKFGFFRVLFSRSNSP